jgi:superoxide dismutase
MSSLVSLSRFLPEAAVAAGAAARFSTAGGVAAYKLPELPYAYSALEPVISGTIMELHHCKHHAGYVANLNKALEEYADAEAKRDLQKMIALQGAINFNGGGAPGRARWARLRSSGTAKGGGAGGWRKAPGRALRPSAHHAPDNPRRPLLLWVTRAGHVNHDIFWTNLAPEKARRMQGSGCCALQGRRRPTHAAAGPRPHPTRHKQHTPRHPCSPPPPRRTAARPVASC